MDAVRNPPAKSAIGSAHRRAAGNVADITTLLAAARDGQAGASEQLFTMLYEELRRMSRRELGKHAPSAALDTTSLVHESFLKLVTAGQLRPVDRKQYLAYAATVMRSVIVDFARSQLARKRGGDHLYVTLDTGVAESVPQSDSAVLRIHEALDELAAIEPRMAKLVEMRYFAGMSEQEVAEALDVSRRTVQRDWEKARLFLATALEP